MASSHADASAYNASEDMTDIESELGLSTELPEQNDCPNSGTSSMKSSYVSEDHWQIVSDENILQGTVWYDDGNVIIQAESTQFKVFQGVLTTHSPVFAEMLQGKEEIEEVDGCRIIRTTDAARDMKYFLEAFHSLTLPEGLTELPQITAFLRLGTRYQVPIVQRIAIRTLLTSYPSSYSAWGKRQQYRSFTPADGASLEVLNLVREFEITQILPTVLYQCSRFCRYETLMQGYNGRRIKDPLDTQRCVIVKAHFAQSVRQAFAFLGDESMSEQVEKGCDDPEACLLERYRLMKFVYEQDTSPLGVQIDWSKWNVCRHCVQHAKALVKLEKQKYWDSLPQLYGLNR